jgi:hypothetical protein
MDSWDFEEYLDKIDYAPQENRFFNEWVYRVSCQFGASYAWKLIEIW